MPDIPVWPQCNINCIFCSNPVSGYRDTGERYTFAEFEKKWKRYLETGHAFLKFDTGYDFISLTGGEPTCNPDFLKILALLRKTWPDRPVQLLTNARMCKYEKFCAPLMKIAGPSLEIKVPVCGYDAKTHEAITRTPGSFSDTVQGLRNMFALRSAGQRIGVRIILNNIQLKWLEKLLVFLLDEFPELDRVELLFVEYEGMAAHNLKALDVSMKKCGNELGRLAPLLRRFRETGILHMPLCALPMDLWPFAWRTLDPIKVLFAPQCARCRARKYCVGIHRSYAAKKGTAEFRPFAAKPKIVESGNLYRPVEKIL